jgi:hypothetical protein
MSFTLFSDVVMFMESEEYIEQVVETACTITSSSPYQLSERVDSAIKLLILTIDESRVVLKV